MAIKTCRFKSTVLLNIILVIVLTATPINGALDSRKLDETTVPGSSGEKCTPCTQSPPPPPPPVLPSPPPPSPPPPSPKKPPSPSKYCPPPPPSPGFIYITGPPGNLYPIDQDFAGAGRNSIMGLTVLISCGLLGLLAFW